jgi:hypothetical protein
VPWFDIQSAKMRNGEPPDGELKVEIVDEETPKGTMIAQHILALRTALTSTMSFIQASLIP